MPSAGLGSAKSRVRGEVLISLQTMMDGTDTKLWNPGFMLGCFLSILFERWPPLLQHFVLSSCLCSPSPTDLVGPLFILLFCWQGVACIANTASSVTLCTGYYRLTMTPDGRWGSDLWNYHWERNHWLQYSPSNLTPHPPASHCCLTGSRWLQLSLILFPSMHLQCHQPMQQPTVVIGQYYCHYILLLGMHGGCVFSQVKLYISYFFSSLFACNEALKSCSISACRLFVHKTEPRDTNRGGRDRTGSRLGPCLWYCPPLESRGSWFSQSNL